MTFARKYAQVFSAGRSSPNRIAQFVAGAPGRVLVPTHKPVILVAADHTEEFLGAFIREAPLLRRASVSA
jgi:hypothetical protein